ncbi:phosphatase PAP2 family protein [Mammaliicoccus stepanovicii]|uniref:Type 2 phosphatidic acid phosphatase family protein n=1 Tax=Mammaliicoccus stepanovicii TaxID=643214 RepID=A0A239ZC21_9STAP|nr:phosphatase PAP2 family protein [Mammaliicoccus stepanovicii]PNZ73873.1 phosphatase PAP2 family protein [Mammaliicoccus stepanovicii]GGI42172.1 phosphatase PAP2 family protein [Mammaliicoccus stepanovicii]SNV68166.1 type 2 phosphatidic acid phosphatase family protein [Mammaliicoccus stepanovicii]
MSQANRTLLILIFSLIFGVIAFFHESRIGKWIDNEVYNFIYSAESFITTSIMLGFTKFGEVWAMIALSLITICYLKLKKYNIETLFFALTMILSGTLNPLLKNIFDRERPTLLRLIDISGFSFPSGHAMGSTAFFGSIIYILYRVSNKTMRPYLMGICVLFIIMISTSRVYLGVHYPTDIIAGIIGGIICILLTQSMLKNKLT